MAFATYGAAEHGIYGDPISVAVEYGVSDFGTVQMSRNTTNITLPGRKHNDF